MKGDKFENETNEYLSQSIKLKLVYSKSVWCTRHSTARKLLCKVYLKTCIKNKLRNFMFICLVVVVVPEHLSYPAELGGGGRGAVYWIFCSKRGWIGRGHSHKLQTSSKVLGRLATFFLIFTSNVEQNISVCRRNCSVISQHWKGGTRGISRDGETSFEHWNKLLLSCTTFPTTFVRG